MKNVAIVGGGLAGLIASIQLAKKGVPCTLYERKNYPFHRVCGEYISNETVSFLKRNDLYPEKFNPPQITQLQLSSVSGYSATMPLDLGGFGISRFNFDHYLYLKALETGVKFDLNTDVTDIIYHDDKFHVKTINYSNETDVAIGSFGKRSKLDLQLNRNYLKHRSPYVGVKYHVTSTHPGNLISLHNFPGGYCGVVNVDGGITNICYLVHRNVVKEYRNIAEMERNVLYKNPLLKTLFHEADFIYDKPLVINEISFATKGPLEKHILLAGDAAGMITPLCGNGMAMAIHSGKIVSELVLAFCEERITRQQLEDEYKKAWSALFAQRLRIGRVVQKLFGNSFTSDIAVKLILHSKTLAKSIVRNTHGSIF